MAAHEHIHSTSSGPLGNGCSHRRFSKRCSCGIFSLFKSHLWFKIVLKNPRKIRFFTLKKKKKIKRCDLGDQKLRAVFCCFCKDWKARKKSIPYFWIISNHAVFSAKLDGSFVDATVLRIVSVEFHPFVWGLMSHNNTHNCLRLLPLKQDIGTTG